MVSFLLHHLNFCKNQAKNPVYIIEIKTNSYWQVGNIIFDIYEIKYQITVKSFTRFFIFSFLKQK